MLRSDLSEFLNDHHKRTDFIMRIRRETDEYGACLKRSGSTCPIYVDGTTSYEITESALASVVAFLADQPDHVRDYILHALLMDPLANRSDQVLELLEELTAPEG